MSKITFRADDDLVERLEAVDASKSEVMREALRQYLDAERSEPSPESPAASSIDDALATRVDDLINERLDVALGEAQRRMQDVNVNITLDGVSPGDQPGRREAQRAGGGRKTRTDQSVDGAMSDGKTCGQCGEEIDGNHVYCPNCGEKATHRVFCDCGDQIRSDWAFCPSCGRRTPAADVLDGP